MIQRFENEYPETRLAGPRNFQFDQSSSKPTTITTGQNLSQSVEFEPSETSHEEEEEEEDDGAIRIPLLRSGSDVSLASRQAQEEGQMHRFGQRIRRDIFRPETLDYEHGTTGHEVEAQHLQDLRHRLEGLNGAEIQEKVRLFGHDKLLEAIGATAEDLLLLEKQDPEGFEQFKEARLSALYNMGNKL